MPAAADGGAAHLLQGESLWYDQLQAERAQWQRERAALMSSGGGKARKQSQDSDAGSIQSNKEAVKKQRRASLANTQSFGAATDDPRSQSGRRASIAKGSYDALKDEMKNRKGRTRRVSSVGDAVDDVPEEEKPFDPKDPPQSLKNPKLAKAFRKAKEWVDNEEKVIQLPRGGVYVKTPAGAIQFGLPPETIKDCMALKLALPKHYIVPRMRFNRQAGVNVAEFEFPTYFNFFVMRGRVNLIADFADEIMIRTVLQETLFGPEDPNFSLESEFVTEAGKAAMPDLQKELDYFRTNPFNPSEKMQIDTLLTFTHFDDDGVATIGEGEDKIEIHTEGDEYAVIHKGFEITRQSDYVQLPSHVLQPTLTDVPPFDVPDFGVTFLGTSHGFDPSGSTTGFIVWCGGRGIMVDPPPSSQALISTEGIPTRLIDAIILTHTHADHDAGTFQKILNEGRITVMTTPTIMNSFLRKYSALCGVDTDLLTNLFHYMPVAIDQKMKINGAEIKFHYTLHAIPCMAFQVTYQGKTIIYSGDTCYIPERIEKIAEEGVISEGRKNDLLNFNWDADLILHEAGVPPIHTPPELLADMSEDVKSRMYCVHVSKRGNMGKPFPFDRGLRVASCGIEHTIRIPVEVDPNKDHIEVLDLLGSLDIFKDFPIWKSRQVVQCYKKVEFGAGDVILKEGEKGDHFYIIQKGVVELKKTNGPRKLYTVGDYFGEMSLVEDHTVRDMAEFCPQMTAQSDVKLIAFSKFDFMCVIRNSDVYDQLVTLSQTRFEPSWDTLGQNTILATLSNGQKTQLQRIMMAKKYFTGETIWNTGEKATFALIVKNGQLEFMDHEDFPPFERGAFIGDVSLMVLDDGVVHKRQTALKCRKDAEVYIIHSESLVGFFEFNPGVLLNFMDRRFVE